MYRDNWIEHVEGILLVGIGGFAGANLRYLVDSVLPSEPVAILAVNVTGCFGIAMIMHWSSVMGVFSSQARMVFGVGVFASFTTYSAFALILLGSSVGFAAVYAALTYAFGVAAILGGRWTASWFGGGD